MKQISNYKNAFRILKGGKISLVTTALLAGMAGSSLSATTLNISNAGAGVGGASTNFANNALVFESASLGGIGFDSIGIDSASDKTITFGTQTNNQFSITNSPTTTAAALRINRSPRTIIYNYGNFNSSTARSAVDTYIGSDGSEGLQFNNYGTVNSLMTALGSAIYLDAPEVSVTNRGTIFGSVNILSSSTSVTDTRNTFVNGSTGILKLNVDAQPNYTLNFDRVSVSGTVTFESGSKIYVNILNEPNNTLIAGNSVLYGVVGGSEIINNGLVLDDNSALLNFEAILNYNNTRMDLKAVKATTILEQTQLGGGKQSVHGSARVLDVISGHIADYSQMSSTTTLLNRLDTSERISKAVESFTPQIATATQTASSQISAGVSGIVTQRQNVSLGGGLNSGDMTFNGKNIWVKPYGSTGSQDDQDNANGFDVKSYGIGIGVDGTYNDNYTVGVGLFYTNADVDMNNVDQKTDLDVFSTLVYGSAPVVDNKTHFMYQIGYASQKTTSQRDIELTSQIANAKYTSNTSSIDLKLARDYRINDSLLVQPIISAAYTKFSSPSYKETGADALDLQVEKASSESMILGVGTNAYYKTSTGDRLVGNINIGYDTKDDKNIVTSSYAGAMGLTFDSEGVDNGRWSYDVGFGYETDMNKLSNINLSYNLQGQGSDYMNHVVSAKYVYKF